ncbi:hypothetical protein PGT21_001366 [Puccinia graminis f. sp. tritici]|uniref:Uncharacterized protein n=1 Tax=Puccinia graminis f. sp. tritici TaxID=56615 RepID=A0A5B0Q9S9_PUCGR|nr:hypothetical protein PGT21_001366 [Puccinia graminis f. sp. tritici]
MTYNKCLWILEAPEVISLSHLAILYALDWKPLKAASSLPPRDLVDLVVRGGRPRLSLPRPCSFREFRRSAAPPSPHPSQGDVYLSSTVLQYSIWSSLTQDLPVPPSPPPSQVTDNLSSQFKDHVIVKVIISHFMPNHTNLWV